MNALAIFFWILLVGVVASAERYGGALEKKAGRLFAGAAVLTFVVQTLEPHRYHRVDYGVAAIDVALFACLLTLAIWSDRTWPIAATALQALPVLSHLGKLINPDFWRLGYAIMASASGIPTLLILAIGIWTYRRRQKTSGASRGFSMPWDRSQRRITRDDC